MGRVTLLTAPAGYGKSVLLTQWAANYEGLIAWFNPVRLYQPEEVLPGCLTTVRLALGIQEEVVPSQWQNSESVADEVVRLVSDYGKPLTLVLDGTQFVGGDPQILQDAFRLVVERLPQNMSIISTSRNIPMAGAETARMSGRLDVIDQSALEIPRKTAVDAFIAKGASAEYAIELAEICNGWPSAVGLVLGFPTLPTDIDELRSSATDQGILRYLSDALIDRITPDLREVLIRTSIADVVTPEFAQALGVTAQQSGALATAIIQGIPAIRVGTGNSFALHPLFRDQLLLRLRRQNPRLENEYRSIYAEYLLANDDPRAIDQLIAIGDLHRAKEVLDENIYELVESGRAIQVAHWLRKLDSQFSDRFELMRRRIYSTIVEGDLVRVESLLESLSDELRTSNRIDPDLMAFVHLNNCWVDVNVGDVESMYENARAVLKLPLDDSNPHKTMYIDNAKAYIARYKTIIEQAPESDPDVQANFSAENPGAVSWKDVQLPAMRSYLAIYRGEVNRARLYGSQALSAVEPTIKHSIFFPWFGLVGYSGALREQGEAEEAISVIDEHYNDLLRFRPLIYVVDILTIRAGALADIGRMGEATDEYGRLRELVDRYGRGWWINDRLDFQEARFLLRHGDESRALQLASRLRDTSTLPALTLHLDLTTAPKRAAQTLGTLKRESPIQEMNFRLFSAMLTKDQPEQADLHLKHLLALMEEHGAMRVVVDRGREAVDLLSVYVSRFPSRYGENLVSRMQEALSSARPSGLVSPLSKREQQILGMIATSMTLKQIADSLFVSQNTLKTHLRHLYRKMQVSGRDQAVEQGRKLLLLP